MNLADFFKWLLSLFKKNNPPGPPQNPDNTASPPTEPTPSPEPEPPPPTEPVIPRLVALTTDDPRLVLYEPTEFKVETEPRGQYQDISIQVPQGNIRIVEAFDRNTGIIVLQFNRRSRDASETYAIKATDGRSTLDCTVTVSLMKLLWKNHAGRQAICDPEMFRNQCAIRMGAALELSSIKLPEDRRILRRCNTEYRTYDDHVQGSIRGHVLAAQELANWIRSADHIFGERKLYYAKEDIIGKSGILFFRDGWDTTDHIDVWDGARMVGGFDSYFDSSFKDLWFWELY